MKRNKQPVRYLCAIIIGIIISYGSLSAIQNPYSLFASGVQSVIQARSAGVAPSDQMKYMLAAMWDLLPTATEIQNQSKSGAAELYKKAFGVAPGDVDLSKANLSSLINLQGINKQLETEFSRSQAVLQAKLEDAQRKLNQEKEYTDRIATRSQSLANALQAFNSAETSLLNAYADYNRAYDPNAPLDQAAVNARAKVLKEAADTYTNSRNTLERIMIGDFNQRVNLESSVYDAIIGGTWLVHGGVEEPLFHGGGSAAAQQSTDTRKRQESLGDLGVIPG